MKKIRLELDSLAVESFDTSPVHTERGTVRAHGTRSEPVDHLETQFTYCGTCFCLGTDNTACGQATCATCPPPPTAAGDPTCAVASCGLTYCVDTCDLCASFITDSPQRC